MILMIATRCNAVADINLNEFRLFPLSTPTYVNFSEFAATNVRYQHWPGNSWAAPLFPQTVRFDTLLRRAHAGVRLLLYRARKLCRQAATLSIHILYKGAQRSIHYMPYLDASPVRFAQAQPPPH